MSPPALLEGFHLERNWITLDVDLKPVYEDNESCRVFSITPEGKFVRARHCSDYRLRLANFGCIREINEPSKKT